MKPSSRVDVPQANDAIAEFQQSIRAFIFSRVKDPVVADDLTQETLVKINSRIGSLREPAKLSAWLFQVARNVVMDYFRKSKPTETFDENRHAAADDRNAVIDEEEHQLGERLSNYIRGVIHGLPPIYREALLLTEYEGLTQVELAKRLEISVPAAKQRVQRARAELKAAIERCCKWETDRYGAVLDVKPRPIPGCGCSSRDS